MRAGLALRLAPGPGLRAGHTSSRRGQDEYEAEYLIRHLTEPGQLVVDPFCGGGQAGDKGGQGDGVRGEEEGGGD